MYDQGMVRSVHSAILSVQYLWQLIYGIHCTAIIIVQHLISTAMLGKIALQHSAYFPASSGNIGSILAVCCHVFVTIGAIFKALYAVMTRMTVHRSE